MPKAFSIFSGDRQPEKPPGKSDQLNHHGNAVLGGAPVPAAPQRSTKARRPQSASHAGARGSSSHQQKRKPKVHHYESQDNYNQVSREDLIVELNELKKRTALVEEISAQLKGENQRLEVEAAKQQRRIDQLLNLSEGVKSASLSSEIKRDIEKSILVRQLKAQINSFRSFIAEKENEMEALRKSLKSTMVMELESEREEYYLEVHRQREIIVELKDELVRERSRREHFTKMATTGGGGGGEDLKNEVARLAAGYQNILSNISARHHSGGGGRPTTASPSHNSRYAATGGSAEDQQKPKRPQSANSSGKRANFANTNNSNTNNGGGGTAGDVSPLMDDPLDNFGVATHHIAEQQQQHLHNNTAGSNQFGVTASSPFAHMKGNSTGGSGFDGNFTNGSSNVPMTPMGDSGVLQYSRDNTPGPALSKSLFKIGDKVEALYYSGSSWYKATVIAASPMEGGAQYVYDLKYDDGDRENRVIEKNIRLQEKAGTGTGTATQTAVTAAAVVKPLYAVGDKLQGQFRGGPVWYNATVKGVAADGTYHVMYDDGDEEKNLSEVKLRKLPDANHTTSKAAATAKAASTNSHVPSQGTDTAPSPQQDMTATNAAIDPSAPAYASKFRKGDIVEGLYDGGVSWYPATVKAVHRSDKSQYLVFLYDLLYDDGDVELKIAENMIRAVKSNLTNAPIRSSSSRDPAEHSPRSSSSGAAAAAEATVLVPEVGITSSAGAALVASNPASPVKSTAVPSSSTVAKKFKVGERVQGLYPDLDEWFDGIVFTVNSDGTYYIQYDDGDEEKNKHVSMIRKLVEPGVTATATATAVTTATGTAPTVVSAHVAVATTDTLKKGDKIEGRYGGGESWYPGIITGLRQQEGTAPAYDLLYDDGDRENAVPSSMVRRAGGATGTGTAQNTISTNSNSDASAKKPPTTTNLDSFLDDLSDDDVGGIDAGEGVLLPSNGAIPAGGGLPNHHQKDGLDYEEDFDA